ncbi:hypothetical protein NEUTE2DRAFT_131966 [Neurospora tetrasperma FGSC 2509]|nr:hypothetical protein NEUTE2DRAFT_131966 [Neurospora tetrasperma FGSC 2509]
MAQQTPPFPPLSISPLSYRIIQLNQRLFCPVMEVKEVEDSQDEIQYCPVGRLAKALKADALAPERLWHKIIVMVFFKRSDDMFENLVEYLSGENHGGKVFADA